MNFNRDKLFEGMRHEFGSLNQIQVDGLNYIINSTESSDLTNITYLAYMLATIKHETANTYLPIAEYGKGKGRPYGAIDPSTGKAYYGRGYVQLTWKRNYDLFSKKLGIDLSHNPDLAMDPSTAFKIMYIGMLEGSFTGKKLSDYITADGSRKDYKNCRKIINGLDKADLIAAYAVKFESILHNSIL